MLVSRNLHMHVLRLYTFNIMCYAYARYNMVTIMVTKRAWTILSPHAVMQEVLAKCRV